MNLSDLTNISEVELLKVENADLKCLNEGLEQENKLLHEQLCKASTEIEACKADMMEAIRQGEILRAQLDMVYLIFGNH